jgi:archaemetzincin
MQAAWRVLLILVLSAPILLLTQMAPRFTPPNPAARLAALGPTTGLPEPLRRALEPGPDFQPVPEPGPSDWLANHTEAGHTFEQFVQSEPNRPQGRRGKLYLLPLGDFRASDGPSLDQLQQFMSAFFVMDVGVLPRETLAQARITSRRNPWTGQVQLLTADVLEILKSRLPDDAFALLGVTMIDLYPDPSWNFVFGQASPPDRVGVYSFARYDPRFYGEALTPDARQLILRRSCKVLAHEAGHLFGIEHCIWYRCLMNGSNHLAEADARPLHLCPVDLRKLQWSIGFQVTDHYRRLQDFSHKAGFEDEAQWLERRMRLIARPGGEGQPKFAPK